MLGFIPGFAYMGDMPMGYFCQRKKDPRTSVPAGSVGLSGLQSAIYPYASPGGWQIIGRTPVQLFDPASETPNFLSPGDRVRFESVDADVFKKNKI
jgi:KipI family sensor histidine kinase inhibitor